MPYIIKPDQVPSTDGMYLFEKKVDVQNSGRYTVRIYASARYILSVNGRAVAEGPCRGSLTYHYYDEIEVELQKGTNAFRAWVMFSCYKFVTVLKDPSPLFIFEAVCGEERIVSDETWQCFFLPDHRLLPQGHYSLPPFEDIRLPGRMEKLRVETVWDCVFNPDGAYIVNGCAYPFTLFKRPIPMILPGEAAVPRLVKSGNGFAEYDAGSYTTAKVSFTLSGTGSVKVIYAECYEFPEGKRLRDDVSGRLDGYYDIIASDGGEHTFETYWFRAFRYIRIEGDNAIVKDITFRRCHYPFQVAASFSCSDEAYNRMFDVSINTIQCCAHELLVDCPYYEQQQYENDACIESFVISRMTEDNRLAQKAIAEFAESQTPNGLLSAVAPSSYTQLIPSYSLFWIMMLRGYLDISGDIDFVRPFFGNMDKIIQYFQNVVRKSGFITPSEYWDFTDWIGSWNYGEVPLEKDEAHTIYNMYYLIALLDAVYLCRKAGRNGLAEEYQGYYDALKETVNRVCWDAEAGFYKDGSKTATYSMHTAMLAVLSGAATVERAAALLDRIYDERLAKSSFSMNFYLFRAFEKGKRYDQAFALFDGWKTMLDLHCTTWCESVDFPRSECHGWSSAPLYELSSNILGVKLSFDNEIVIAPVHGHLCYARGIVPTRFGNLSVDWEIRGDVFSIRVSGADGTQKKIILPSGKTAETCGNEIFLEETL